MRYIKIAQAAQRLEVSTKTLRRWEESGILVPKRTPAGQRVYLNSQIESFVRPQKQSGRKKLSGVSIKKAVYTSAFSFKSFAAGSAALTAIFIILLNLFNAQLSIKTQPVNTNVLGVKTSVPKGMASVFTEMLVSESKFFTSSLKTVQIAVLDALLGRTTVNVSQVVNEIATNEVVKPFELLDRSVTGTHIAIKTIKSENIANNQITADKIAVSLVFTAGQLIDLSKVSHITTSKQGLILPNTSTASPAKPSSGEGYLAYDTNGNQLIIFNGSSWQTVGGDGNSGGDITDVSAGAGLTGGGGSGDITLNIVGGNGFLVSGDQIDLDIDTTGTSSNTSSNSGLELTSTGLSLLRGCSNSQILKWNASSEVWYCSADTGGSGSALDIQEGGSVIVSAASAANFTANDFSVSNSPSGVGLISIDYVNSKISRTDASETLTNKTIAAGSNTITGLTNTNLSGSAGITNANLANSSVTINSSGILTGGGSVSLGGTLNLTATEADTLATVTGRGATTSNSITLSSASPLALTNISPVVSIGTGNSDATLTIKDTAGSPNTLLTLTDSGSVGNLTVSGTIAASNFSGSSSGTNTGDQTITLTGDVTGTGTGSFATTIAANSVALTTDTTGNYVADVTAGNGAITIGSSAGEGWSPSVSLAIQSSGNGLSATTSNGSGLEITSGGLTMLQGCDDGQILKWNETSDVWACSADTTGASSLIVKEGGTTIVGSASAQNFSGSDFIVTDEGSNVAGIAVDYVNSKISRYDASETLTNKTIAAGSNTITGLTNSNLSGSAGITNANLANSSVTINSSGILTGGGSVSLGGTLNLTATEVDTLASVTGRGASTATGITLSSASPLTLSNSAPVVTLGTGDANATFIIKDSAGSPNTLLTLTDTGTVGNLSVSGTVTGSNLSGTNTGDQTITLTGDVTGTGTGSFATTIAANSVALTTDTTGNYVATGASGNGVSLTGGGSEGATLTAALGALTGDWDQTGAFDIALNNSSSELKILESGSTPTLFGIFDVGDLSSSDSTFTFSGSSGTVLTSANYTGTLDSVYVNVAESPTSADIAGSFSAGLTINTNTIDDAELVDSLTYTGALSVGNLTISDTGVPLTGASFAFDFNNASDRTLTIANSGAGTANLSVDGTIAASNFSGSSSGTNTGDQTITLTGDVTGTGTGSFATTIAANSVALTADTTGNYVATLTNGVGITGADGGGEGSTLTLAVDQGASFTFTGNNAFTPSTTNDLTINTDADSTFAQVFSSATNNTSSNTVSLTNSASSGTIAVKGLDFTFVGTDNAGGANTITGINFGNATAHTNNTYNGLTFGTGYTNFLTSGTINIAAGGTITGATISGGSNTISNIGNSSLTNSSVTINSSGILTGGGSVSLGGTLNLTATEADTLASVTGRGATTSTAVTLSNASNSITAGTLTATGGTINGTVIGGSTPAAATFTSLTANGDIALGDAITDAITFTGRVAQDSDLLPITATGTNDIGSIALPFDNIYSNAVYQNGNLVCDSSGANCPAGAGYWGQALGALNPNNNTVDLLIGGNATTSAKFAFKNVLTGTPTASISGTTAFVSTFLTGEGNLAVTNMADLTLGGSSTGNVVINSRGSTALTANGSNVVVGGNISAANLSGTNTGDQTITLTGDVTGTGTSSFATTIAANSVALTADTTGNYVGTLTNGVGITGADGGGEGSTLTLAVDQAASFTLTGNNTFTPSTTNDLTINLDADSTLAEVFSSGTNSTSANTISLTNTASSGTVAVKGLDFTFVGTDNAGGANTITGINFGNATAHTNNTYNGLTFGTGYTNFLTSGTINIAAGGTITGATLAAGSNTISGLTNSNLSGSAGITNANLANSSVTINSSGILTGGGSVSLGGTLNLTATEADTLATVTGRGATTSTAVTLSNASNSITAGTLTATGGSIDGTTVGASTPSTGAFTTLSSTGDVTMNDAGADNILIGAAADTVTLTSNTLSLTDDNWSVSAAGAATFASVTEGGTSLAAKYAPIAANFVTVTSNGTLTGETGIDALVTAISTTSTLNVDSTTTLNTTTIDVGANLSLADGVGTYVQTFSPLGTTAAPKGLTVTPKFTLDATDQTLSAIYVNPNTNSNNDSGDTLYGLNLDNVTDSTAVESAIRIGSGWNNALDLNGTLITSTELAIVDGGIALSELTDSGTLTAGTVDINGGAVDGTTIGATSPSTGAFTTLSATGDVTMNDSSADTILIGQSGATDDTVTIAGNISLTDDQWSISATGVATGITGITADSVSFANVTGATNTNTLVIGSGGSLATSGTGTITATDLVCTGCVDATDLGANSVDDSELVDALTYTGALTLTPATTTDFTLNTDADSTFIQAFTSATNNTSSNTVSLTNSASSGTIAVKGLDFTFVGTDNAGGANTITGINFGNATAHTNNTYNGLTFGTGYTNFLTSGTINIAAGGTITGSTIAAGSNTITGLTNSNLSGSAGITNANLANSSVTINSSGILTGGGSVSLGGTLNLTATEADTLATVTGRGATTSTALTLSNASNSITAGTLTATGGSIDGTTVGASTPSTGAFTTLSATGDVTMNDAGADNILIGAAADTVTLTSNTLSLTDDNWSVSAAGAAVFASVTEGGTSLAAKYAPIAANFITVTSNGTLTGETGIDALSTAISTTSTLNVDSTSTLNTTTIDANANLSLADGTGTYVQTFSPLGTTAAPKGLTVTPKFTLDATDQTLSTIYVNANTNSNNDSGDTLYGVNLDNITGSTAVESALRVGSGWDNALDLNGTLITSTELSIVDGGIALSELTDSGTLTAGTVDINGGAIDGTTIGATSPSTGAFTTLSATGDVTMNDASADTILIGQSGATDDTVTIAGAVSLTDDQWSVTDAGVASFVTGSTIGSITFTTNNIADSGALTIKSATSNALTLDSGTTGTVNVGTGNNAKTIAIGTGNAGNTINIGTNNTVSDTISIGSVLDNVSITGDAWSITDAGVLTVASCTGCGGAGGTLDSVYETGNTLTTSDARDAILVFADTSTDSNFNIDLEADNTVTVTRNATASTEVPAQLVLLENADADVTVTAGLSVLESGGNIATGINVGSGMTVGINLNANTIENIGNAGTDFDSSGGLTLASTLVLSNNTLTCTGCIDVTDLGANSVDDSELVDSLSYTGTLTIATNALAVNSDSITADGATLTINAAGNVDVQDALNADSITSDAGVSIGNGSSYTGSGNVTLSSGGSGTLTLSSATGTTDISSTLRFTGASTDITTGINESFTIAPNGIGDFVISVDDNTNIQANATITGTNSIDLYTSALTNQTTSGTQRGLSLSVANDSSQTQTTEQLIYLSNLETTGTLTDAIFVEQNASGGTLTNALHITNTAGTLANAIVIDGIAPSSNILSTESIDISGAGAISGVTTLGLSGAITGATATNTINGAIINGSTQTFSANNIADSGSLTIKSASGASALTLDSGTTGTVNLGTSNNAKTIAIGTGNAGNTINVGTDNTVSDTITIGSALDNVSITGDQWSITDAGVLTVASCSGCGGGGSTLQSAYDASSGNTILTTTGRNIAFTLGEVASPTSLILTNQDTAGVTAFGITNSIASGTLTNGILIDQTGAGALTSAIKIVETSGTITDGLVISGTLSNILNSDSIDITGAGAITGATGVGTTTLTSTGTTNIGSNLGAVTIDSTGSVIINDTAISLANQATDFDIRDNTSSAFTVTEGTNEYLGISTNNGAPVVSLNTQEAGGTINIGSANFDRTINIGTGTGADAINIGTGATTADTLTFGNTGVATTFTFNSGATTQTPVTFNLDALTQGTGVDLSLDGLTTGLGLKVDDNTGAGLTSGTLVYVNSVSTALTAPTNGGSLAYFNWNPASTTDATGDLFRINIGSNGSTSGNLFNITDNGSTLFSVSENLITSALPHSFSAVGDVAISYDLVFTNQTSSLIDSYGPLTIRAGESFENNNLTLTTFGTGAIIADTKFSFDTQLTLGDSTTPSVTSGNHYIEANSTNRLVTNFINGTAGQVIFIEVGTSNLDLDCTSSSINCGTTDMTGLAAGDQIFLIYDGSTWNLLGWMDASANNNDNTDGVDIAEFFPSLQGLAPGEVVKIDINNPEHVVRSASAYENMVVGIVSTQPGITLGSNNGNAYAIALAGRVPVQISNLSENISAGDYITTSTISGKAMKATGTGRVIGQSLENWSPSSGKSEIVVFINNSWFENMPTIEQDGNLSLDLRAENIIATNIKSSRIQPAEGETDISIQIGSNSTPSGRLKIENIIGETVLEVDNGGNATISGDLHTVGDLYATNVHSQNIEDIEALLAQVQSDQALLLASNSGIFSATTSASLNDLMTSDLYVTNQAAVYSLSVTSSIAVGSDLVIQSTDSSINTLVAPLKIQSLALAPIEIMGGLVKIDTFGNAEIEGNLAVKGVLSTSGIIITGDTAGKAKVPEGEVEVVLQNPNIKEGTLVFVTPTSPTSNGLYVKSQEAGSVTVGFVLAEDFDVTFNWWIVGTSGQVDASGSGVISNP